MSYETIIFQVEGSVARTTINRPDNANAINLQFAAVKALLLSSAHNSLETQMELESRAISALSAGKDGQEGINAFLEKRKPEFNGKS